MKYIRTNDGIYEEHKVPCLKCKYFPKNILTGEGGCQGETFYCVYHKADTIEELCDEFVWKAPNNTPLIVPNIHNMNIEKEIKNECIVYGAIWTDKGLIYVAKMNDKGELELL